MRDNHQWTGLQLQLQILPKLALDPGRPYACRLLVLEGEREIQNGAAAISSFCPALTRGVLVAGEKREIHFLELVAADTLNEGNFFAYGLKLSQGFIVIQQFDVSSRKLALAEHVGDFFALKSAPAHQGHAIEAGARIFRDVAIGFFLRAHDFRGLRKLARPPGMEAAVYSFCGTPTAIATEFRRTCMSSPRREGRAVTSPMPRLGRLPPQR